ncbi:MAG TPA: CcmD family protein [Bacteroidales bacterium]|nr:CcmD family protein [Bacteroidales bacterium]
MFDTFGKIFVVVAVLALILVGIMVYLYLMDRKLSKLEKEVEDQFSTGKE